MKLLATWAAVAGIVSAHMPSIASSGIRSSKACHDLTFQIPVTARNGVFDNIATPKTNLEATTFGQAASQQGFNGTKEALTGYATISNTYSISATYCMPNSSSTTRGTVLQILTHGIGFDKSYVT